MTSSKKLTERRGYKLAPSLYGIARLLYPRRIDGCSVLGAEKLSKIEFSEPRLRRVRRVIEYELDGVAFIEGYEKTVKITFECHSPTNLRLTMEDLYQAKEVYNFFKTLFRDYSKKSGGMTKTILGLYVEWNMAEEKLQGMLDKFVKP